MIKKQLEVMEEYAKLNKVPIMEQAGIEFLSSLIKEEKVQSVLELGSAIGYSAIQMAKVNRQISVCTIERDEQRYQEAKKNICLCDMENQIELHLGDALTFETEEQFDLIFIDAAKAQYINFFERYQKNLKENGLIISDNLKFHGFVDAKEPIKNRNTRQLVGKIKKYISYLNESKDYETIFYDIGDGVAVSRRRNIKR